MKLRSKLFSIQGLLLVGFILAFGLILFRYSQAYRLKRLEFQSIHTLAAMKTLRNETELFVSQRLFLTTLWVVWVTAYDNFDENYIAMLDNPAHRLLGREHREERDRQKETWERLKNEEIAPKIKSSADIIFERLEPIVSNRGIVLAREFLVHEQGADHPDVVLLDDVIRQFDFIRNVPESGSSEVSSESFPRLLGPRWMAPSFTQNIIDNVIYPETYDFVAKIEKEVENFSGSLYISTILLALIIIAAGTFAGSRLSGSINQHLRKMEDAMAGVAIGNFETRLDLHTGDEFETFSTHFNTLVRELWNRLKSMKDMLQNVGQHVTEKTELDTLETFILNLAVENTNADAGVFLLPNDEELVLSKSHGYFPPPMALPPMVRNKREYVTEWFASYQIPIDKGLLGQAMQSGKPKFIRNNAENTELPDNADPETDLYINSLIVIPLVISGTSLGILALAHTEPGRVFTDLHYTYMCSYGEFVALTLDNFYNYLELVQNQEINKEITVAADIQKTLLPDRIPQLDGVQAAAFSEAAKGVSGDYYDIFELERDKIAVVICDVAGKGVPASLLMIMIRTILRTISTPEKRADRIMVELNQAITGKMSADRFATISLIILDSAKGVVSYVNGAHHPLFIFRNDTKTFKKFDTEGLPLGIDNNAVFGHKMIRVHPRDYLLLFTDGLPEARNPTGEELGTERLLQFIARHIETNPKTMVKSLRDYIETFTSGIKQHDDQTFIALKMK